MNHEDAKTRSEPVDDGGPAFPGPEIGAWGTEGMSLRDWFAGQATDKDVAAQQEWTTNTMRHGLPSNSKPKFTRAECRYRHADAMLAERKKGRAAG